MSSRMSISKGTDIAYLSTITMSVYATMVSSNSIPSPPEFIGILKISLSTGLLIGNSMFQSSIEI